MFPSAMTEMLTAARFGARPASAMKAGRCVWMKMTWNPQTKNPPLRYQKPSFRPAARIARPIDCSSNDAATGDPGVGESSRPRAAGSRWRPAKAAASGTRSPLAAAATRSAHPQPPLEMRNCTPWTTVACPSAPAEPASPRKRLRRDSGTDRPTTESMIGMPVPDMAMPMSTPPFTAKSRGLEVTEMRRSPTA